MPEGLPLPQIIPPDLFPLDRLDPGGDIIEVLSRILVTEATQEALVPGPGGRYSLGLTVAEELVLELVGLDGFALVLGGASMTTLRLGAEVSPSAVKVLIGAGSRLRFPRAILKPVALRDGQWVDDPSRPFAEIEINVGVIIDDQGNVTFDGANAFTLQPAMVADSGFVIEGEVALDLSETTGLPESAALGLPPTWLGIVFRTFEVHLPPAITEAVPIASVVFEDFHIGSGGVSGRIRLNGAPAAGALAGFPFTPTAFEILLKQNSLIGASLAGRITLPFLDHPMDVEVGFDLSGNMTIEIGAGTGGLVSVDKPGLLAMTIESVAFEKEGDLFTVALSGTLTPRVGGLDWPTFRVERLSIDSEGHVRIEGGWLDLPEQYVLGFYGFQLSISRIGFGTETDGKRWIGFNGALRLVEGLSAGASVEGMRVRWSPSGPPNPSLSLEGVGIEFEVPGAVSFKGFVAMREPEPGVFRFDGDIELQLIALGLSIDGQVVIGYDSGDDFTFFAIYVGVELPVGIPLWTTGLGLYGFAGLFALNMEPGRHNDEAWYAIQPAPSWYHRNPPGVGVAELRKWDDAEGSLGFGAGITIGTVVDNGFTFAGKMLFVIVFPGPILMLEGRANILKERASLADEPVFRALVVLDGREGTLLAGLDAHYAIADDGELIDIAGSIEAFFDFDDPGAWHLYLGIDEPREKRIGADIFFHIFRSEAYLMINPDRLRTGAWVGMDMRWQFGPLRVVLQAWMEGHAQLSFKPVYLQGSLTIHGGLEVSVFGFGFSLGATATLSAGVFDPFYLRADLSVSVGLPWPLPDFDVDIVLEWGPEADPPLLPATVKEVAIAHEIVSATWPLPAGSLLLPKIDTSPVPGFFDDQPPALTNMNAAPPAANLLPVVPLDARPDITFGRPVHDEALVGDNPSPAGWTWIGDQSANRGAAQVRARLTEVSLARWSGSSWLTVARSGVTPNPAGVPRLHGVWMPTPDSDGPANVKLRIWSKTPFTFTSHTGGEWDNWFLKAYPNYPCVDHPKDQRVCCDFHSVAVGTRLDPPWRCDTNDVFSLTWPPRLRPVIEEHQGSRALCFREGSRPVVLLHKPAKKVILTVHREREGDRDCLDFRDRRASRAKNPRTENGYAFAAYAGGGNLAASSLIGIATMADGQRVSGLNLDLETHVELPGPSSSVTLWISTSAPPVFVTAIDSNDKVAAQEAVTAKGLMTEIILTSATGAPIEKLHLRGIESNTAYLHEICAANGKDAPVWAESLDAAGGLLGHFDEQNGMIEVDARDATSVDVGRSRGRFCIIRVCAIVGLSAEDSISLGHLSTHVVDALSVWSSEGDVLLPNSTFRLLVGTQLDVDLPAGSKVAAGFEGTRPINQVAYFRTEGPPGLTALTKSGNALVPGAGGAGATDAPAIETGLEDLTRYVKQTVPATVPLPGQPPLLTRPVYRGYDVGVAFWQNYIDTMFGLAGRDLSLALFDTNDQPVRDNEGRALIVANRWSRAETLTLTESEQRWLEVVNNAHCTSGIIDLGTVVRPQTVQLDSFVLDPSTTYEARLQPMLLHETFDGFTLGSVASGSGATLSGGSTFTWTVTDVGSSGAPSLWRIGEAGTPVARFIEQTSDIAIGSSRNRAFPGGTLLTATANQHLTAAHRDQPANWTDYRVSAFVRSTDDDVVGVGIRIRGLNGYLVKLDRQRNLRQLVLLRPTRSLVLASQPGGYTVGVDTHLSIEAVGARIRVHADGELLFDISNAVRTTGSIALYTADNAGARFTDVRVDDLRNDAPVVYRFKFTSSGFANFRHHLQSSSDVTFRAAANAATIAGAQPLAIDPAAATAPPSEAEGRAYEAVAAAVLAGAARQPVTTVEATRVIEGAATAALLVRTAEPIDWHRTTLSIGNAPAAPAPEPATGAKLIDAGFATGASPNPLNETATVLLLEPCDLSDHAIERRTLPSPTAPDLPDGELLYSGDFITTITTPTYAQAPAWRPPFNALSEVTLVVPTGTGTANWQINARVLSQTGSFAVPDLGLALPLVPRPERGTLAIGTGAGLGGDIRFAATVDATGVGAAGLVFRYIDPQNYYRFSVDRIRGRRYLSRFVAGNFTVLHTSTLPPGAPSAQLIVVEALGNRLSVSIDGSSVLTVTDGSHLSGQVGFYSHLNPQVRFSNVTVDRLTTLMGDWRIDDVSASGERSRWSIENGLLQKAASASPAPAGTAFAVIDGAQLSDVRITTAIAPVTGTPGLIGVTWRYESVGQHVRFVITPSTLNAQLIRRVGNIDNVLWTGLLPASGASTIRQLTVTAVGRRLRVNVDGVEIADVSDAGLGSGSVGAFGDHGAGLQAWPFAIAHSVPRWEPWYRFGAERRRTSGRRTRVSAAGSQPTLTPPAGEDYRWIGKSAAGFKPAFPAEGIDLRLQTPARSTLHSRRFRPDSAYTALSARILRAPDSTGVLVLPNGTELPPGEIRLGFGYRRDNSAADSTAQILSEGGERLPEDTKVSVF